MRWGETSGSDVTSPDTVMPLECFFCLLMYPFGLVNYWANIVGPNQAKDLLKYTTYVWLARRPLWHILDGSGRCFLFWWFLIYSVMQQQCNRVPHRLLSIGSGSGFQMRIPLRYTSVSTTPAFNLNQRTHLACTLGGSLFSRSMSPARLSELCGACTAGPISMSIRA